MCVPKVFMEYRCFFFIIKSGLQCITSGSASCLRKGRPYCPPSLTVQDTIRNNDKLKQACLCVEIMQKKLKGNIKKRLEGLEYKKNGFYKMFVCDKLHLFQTGKLFSNEY